MDHFEDRAETMVAGVTPATLRDHEGDRGTHFLARVTADVGRHFFDLVAVGRQGLGDLPFDLREVGEDGAVRGDRGRLGVMRAARAFRMKSP
jgi:hypothetical protein